MIDYNYFISRYNPGYAFDYEKLTLGPIPNYFSDLLAEQAELSKTGNSQLTQEEIQELSGKCDISQMTSQEYNDLITFLADRGIIDHPEPPLDIPLEQPVYVHGYQAWFETEKTGARSQSIGVPNVTHLPPYLEGLFNRLLAEQAAAKALRSTGRIA